MEQVITNGTTNRTSDGNFVLLSANTYLAFWIVMGVIGLAIVLGNILVIWLVVTRKRLRIKGNLFIVSLSVADMGVGLTAIPSSFIYTFVTKRNFFIADIFIDFFLCSSIGNLITLTLDRYIAVVSPLRYSSFMTNKMVIIIVILGWLLPSLTQLLPSVIIQHMTQEARKDGEKVLRAIQIFVFGILSCIIMLIVYLRIFMIARKHHRKTLKVEKSLSFNMDSNGSLTLAKNQPSTHDKSFVHVLGTVIVLFIVCYLLTIYRGICDYFKFCNVPLAVILVSRLLLLGNSAVNPIVYSLMKNDFRKELKKVVRTRRKRVTKSYHAELLAMRNAASDLGAEKPPR